MTRYLLFFLLIASCREGAKPDDPFKHTNHAVTIIYEDGVHQYRPEQYISWDSVCKKFPKAKNCSVEGIAGLNKAADVWVTDNGGCYIYIPKLPDSLLFPKEGIQMSVPPNQEIQP